MNWTDMLDDFGRSLLEVLDEDPYNLPRAYNPVVRALKDPKFVQMVQDMPGFGRASMARVATICQMVIYDSIGGPDGDTKPKMLRRHWYHWFKVKFAQPFAEQLEDYDLIGTHIVHRDLKWSGLLSRVYAWFVDTRKVTYKDLWVKDDSRMVARMEFELFNTANIIVAVEKDSLFNDFKGPATALGAKVLLSGRGKSSKAAIEKVLRDHFGWTENGYYNWDTGLYEPVFTSQKPLVILHISDHDYDGEQVIGPTFGEQARRYTPHIVEARVGVSPYNLDHQGYPLEDVMYQVKVNNNGYIKWAEKKALFWAECTGCGKRTVVQGTDHELENSDCCWAPYLTMTIQKGSGDTPYGLEVESMPTRDYHALLVQALLSVVDFDYIVRQLREEASADAWMAAESVLEDISRGNDSMQALQEEWSRLNNLKLDFEEAVRQAFWELGRHQENMFEWEGDDPMPSEYVEHVERADIWMGPWRPFDREKRTVLLAEYLNESQVDLVQTWKDEEIDW